MNEIIGTDGADRLRGSDAADVLLGGASNDVLIGGGGIDTFDGGAGIDTVDFSYTDVGSTIDLSRGEADFGRWGVETLTAIENVVGTAGDDVIVGNGGINALEGGDGDDLLIGGTGRDRFEGGAGRDTVDFSYTSRGLTIDLSAHHADFGEWGREILIGIENVRGSSGRDLIIGDEELNVLEGGAGRDTFRLVGVQPGVIDRLPDFDPRADRLELVDMLEVPANEVTDANLGSFVRIVGVPGANRLQIDPDGRGDAYDFVSVADMNGRTNMGVLELGRNLVLTSDVVQPAPPPSTGPTGTGLDQLVEVMLGDEILARKQTAENLDLAARSMAQMNHILIDAIKATGVANDGNLTGGDLIDINRYIDANAADAFAQARGSDVDGVETGFHLVLGNGDTVRLYGSQAVDTVMNGLYLLGGDIEEQGGNMVLLDEDGDRFRRLDQVADWLEALLEDDLAAGTLVNPNIEFLQAGTTGTDFDLAVEEIVTNRVLAEKVAAADRDAGARTSDWQSKIIIEAIYATETATDGFISTGDVKLINEYINYNYLDLWIENHGRFFNDERSGWHLVVGIDGTGDRIFNTVGLDYFWDGLFHWGFDMRDGRFQNANGALNISVDLASDWTNFLLREELARGDFADPSTYPELPDDVVWPTGRPYDPNFGPPIPPELIDPDVEPNNATGTYLDRFVDLIYSDDVLRRSVGAEAVEDAARAAEIMNGHIIDALQTTGVAADGFVSRADIYALNAQLMSDPSIDWAELRRPDGGFDGITDATADFTFVFGLPAFRSTMDQFYSLGFAIENDRFVNLEGKPVVGVGRISSWFNGLLEEELDSGFFADTAPPMVTSPTDTGLAAILDVIQTDPGLVVTNTPASLRAAAGAAADLNELIVEAVEVTGAANDGRITGGDVIDMNAYLRANHLDAWAEGYDGYASVIYDGAETEYLGRNAINEAFDAVYRLGFTIDADNHLVEDSLTNRRQVKLAASTLDELLEDDLADGSLVNADITLFQEGTTGTNLDVAIDVIWDDVRLNDWNSTQALDGAARAADAMNHAILDAIDATGIYDDGDIAYRDVETLNAYLRASPDVDWAALRSNDGGLGFDAVVAVESSPVRLFGELAYDRVLDGLYNIGFETEDKRFLNRDGEVDAGIGAVQNWLNGFLDDDPLII